MYAENEICAVQRRGPSASELGLTTKQLAAMLEVRELLASNVIRHVDPVDVNRDERSFLARTFGETPQRFNMNYTIQHKGCGTVACIGGWTALRAGMSRRAGDKFVKLADGGLRELFYPLVPGSNNKVDQNVTNEQAV